MLKTIKFKDDVETTVGLSTYGKSLWVTYRSKDDPKQIVGRDIINFLTVKKVTFVCLDVNDYRLVIEYVGEEAHVTLAIPFTADEVTEWSCSLSAIMQR